MDVQDSCQLGNWMTNRWQMIMDGKSRQFFYADHLNKKTHWNKPDDVFENYDDYYYYDDHSSESRVKRDLPSYNCKPTYGVPKEIKACR